jgi:glycerol-3-phosphate acyltransferase PlsY
MIWWLVPAAYLLGTFPSAVMVARAQGVDITAVGSGNPGASNVARTMGTAWGVLVFVLDGLKGAIPALTGVAIDEPKPTYALVAAAVIGHMYPVTRRFVGGKGVATVGGAMVVLHLPVFLMLTIIWIAIRKVTGKASLGSLVIAIGLPLGVALAGSPGWEIASAAGLAALVLMRHVDNIKRLVRGSELAASKARGHPSDGSAGSGAGNRVSKPR